MSRVSSSSSVTLSVVECRLRDFAGDDECSQSSKCCSKILGNYYLEDTEVKIQNLKSSHCPPENLCRNRVSLDDKDTSIRNRNGNDTCESDRTFLPVDRSLGPPKYSRSTKLSSARHLTNRFKSFIRRENGTIPWVVADWKHRVQNDGNLEVRCALPRLTNRSGDNCQCC